MNKIVNKFLFAGNKVMFEFLLRQPRLKYSGCRLFTKHRKWFKKFRETGDLNHIHKKLDQKLHMLVIKKFNRRKVYNKGLKV